MECSCTALIKDHFPDVLTHLIQEYAAEANISKISAWFASNTEIFYAGHTVKRRRAISDDWKVRVSFDYTNCIQLDACCPGFGWVKILETTVAPEQIGAFLTSYSALATQIFWYVKNANLHPQHTGWHTPIIKFIQKYQGYNAAFVRLGEQFREVFPSMMCH